MYYMLKAAVLQLPKQIKIEEKIKLTVNYSQVMFNGKIYYTDPLI